MASFTTADGVRLHYEIEGDGPPLILQLGAGCDSDLWRAAGYVGTLSKNRTCVLFDHRGHGESDHPGGSEANHIDRYVDDLVRLINTLGHSTISFFGWSNAVIVGLKAAEQHSLLFDALVLFGPIAPRETPEQLEAASERRVKELRQRGWWLLLDDMVPAEKHHPVPQWMIDRIVATDIEPFIGWIEARARWCWNPWDALARVDVPTLMIVGELEDLDDTMGEAATLMPNASRVRIPEREQISAFLASDLALPSIEAFFALCDH
jgi:pimeloyl-ACP methyl ester carboxylesterase